jgi:flagellar biosynthesis protein FlhF
VEFAEAPLAVNAMAAFIGPTGVGKTTTIAKLAARVALRARRRVEMITLDTYRIAAVEQLKTYAEIIGAGCHVARSVVELDALTQRLAGEATVLIDTTGRSPHDLADQLDLADYLRGNESLLKCLVLPATTHSADAQLATNKFALYGANRLVLTKLDETVQPGAAVGVAADAELPLIYLSAGQRVPEDLDRATATTFADYVVRARGDTA